MESILYTFVQWLKPLLSLLLYKRTLAINFFLFLFVVCVVPSPLSHPTSICLSYLLYWCSIDVVLMFYWCSIHTIQLPTIENYVWTCLVVSSVLYHLCCVFSIMKTSINSAITLCPHSLMDKWILPMVLMGHRTLVNPPVIHQMPNSHYNRPHMVNNHGPAMHHLMAMVKPLICTSGNLHPAIIKCFSKIQIIP